MMLRQLVVSVIASLKRTASQAAQMAILRLVIKSVCSQRWDGMIKAAQTFSWQYTQWTLYWYRCRWAKVYVFYPQANNYMQDLYVRNIVWSVVLCCDTLMHHQQETLLETLKMTSSYFGVKKIPNRKARQPIIDKYKSKWDIRLKKITQNQNIL